MNDRFPRCLASSIRAPDGVSGSGRLHWDLKGGDTLPVKCFKYPSSVEFLLGPEVQLP